MPNVFNPLNQTVLSDTQNAFSSVGDAVTDESKQFAKFQTGSANGYSNGTNVNDPSFRAKEIALLKDRIKSGLASPEDIKGYTVDGRKIEDLQSLVDKKQDFFGSGQRTVSLARETELGARVDQYIAIVKAGDTIDSATRDELIKMYQNGAKSGDIAANLKKAVDGVGIYGQRQNNVLEQKASAQRTVGDNRLGII